MSGVFHNAHAFNQPLDNWLTNKVISICNMFRNAYNFNQPLNNWSTNKVTDMGCMFYGACNFNQPLNNWVTNKVTCMKHMFYDAYAFNQPLTNWPTDIVNNISYMFYGARTFNQDISYWNISNAIYKHNIITNTELFKKLNGSSCFDKYIMHKLFSYDRRKNFLLFLVESSYIPYKGRCLKNSHHKVFSREDIYRSIMAYV